MFGMFGKGVCFRCFNFKYHGLADFGPQFLLLFIRYLTGDLVNTKYILKQNNADMQQFFFSS